jgi:hypothetical protein
MRDFIRAGAMYPMLLQPDKMALVLLLSTPSSWNTTVDRHEAGDARLCRNWTRAYHDQTWDVRGMAACPGVRAAVGELRAMGVPIPNIIHSDLLYSVTIRQQRSERAMVRCWSVWKPQNTAFLDDQALDAIAAGSPQN